VSQLTILEFQIKRSNFPSFKIINPSSNKLTLQIFSCITISVGNSAVQHTVYQTTLTTDITLQIRDTDLQ